MSNDLYLRRHVDFHWTRRRASTAPHTWPTGSVRCVPNFATDAIPYLRDVRCSQRNGYVIRGRGPRGRGGYNPIAPTLRDYGTAGFSRTFTITITILHYYWTCVVIGRRSGVSYISRPSRHGNKITFGEKKKIQKKLITIITKQDDFFINVIHTVIAVTIFFFLPNI